MRHTKCTNLFALGKWWKELSGRARTSGGTHENVFAHYQHDALPSSYIKQTKYKDATELLLGGCKVLLDNKAWTSVIDLANDLVNVLVSAASVPDKETIGECLERLLLVRGSAGVYGTVPYRCII